MNKPNPYLSIKVDLEFSERDIKRAQFFWGDDWRLCEARTRDALQHLNRALEELTKLKVCCAWID